MAENGRERDWSELPQIFGVPKLKEFFGIGEAAAYNLTKRNDFPCLKIGRNIRISKDGLRRWVEQQTA